MKKKRILFLIIFILLSNFVFPDDYSSLFDDIDSNDTTVDSVSTDDSRTKSEFSSFTIGNDFSLNFDGEHIFDFHIPVIKDHINFDGNIKSPKFKNQLGLSVKYKSLFLISNWQIDIFLNQFGDLNNLISAYPLENYISWSPWKFILRAGFQEFVWGTGDKINPTDNINPKDLTYGAENVKRTILSAYVGFYPFDFMSIETVYVPCEQNNIYPVDFAEKIPAQIFSSISLNQIIVNPMDPSTWLTAPVIKQEEKIVNTKFGEWDPKNFLIGGKLNFFFRFVDFSFSYLYDIDPFYTPVIDLEKENLFIKYINGDVTTDIPTGKSFYKLKSVNLERKRLHHFGADLRASIDRFGIWAEICYTMTEDYSMSSYKKRNHKLSWVTGFDFTYGPNGDFTFNFQYLGEFIPLFDNSFYSDYEDGQPDFTRMDDKKYMSEYYYRMLTNPIGNQTEALTQGFLLNMKWPVMNNLLVPSFTAAYYLPLLYNNYIIEDNEAKEFTRYGGILIKPELDIMPIDSFHIIIGADLFFSFQKIEDKDVELCYTDNIGTNYKNSNIYILIKYKWGMEFKK